MDRQTESINTIEPTRIPIMCHLATELPHHYIVHALNTHTGEVKPWFASTVEAGV